MSSLSHLTTYRSVRFGFAMLSLTAGILGNTVLADIAPDPLSGGKNLAIKGDAKTNVAMVDEIVKLKVARDTCHVDVVFTMKNTGQGSETMQVGFPHNYPDELKDFKAAVDDRSVTVKAARESQSDNSGDFPRSRTILWKTWETTFPPDRPVKIAVSYSTKLKDRFTWTVSNEPIAHRLSELVPQDDRPNLMKQLATRNVEYILRTGSHWAGPIGRCRIEVTFQGMTTDNLTLESPRFERSLATITQDKIVWDLKDYEPKQDVYFTITPEITRAATLKLLETFQQQHPQDPAVTDMLYDYLVVAKRQTEADALMLKLLEHWQDKIAIWGPQSERGQTLRQSQQVFSMIGSRINPKLKRTPFQNPASFAPVIERIALRVKDQLKFVPPDQADRAKYFVEQIDKMLEWSKKHT